MIEKIAPAGDGSPGDRCGRRGGCPGHPLPLAPRDH